MTPRLHVVSSIRCVPRPPHQYFYSNLLGFSYSEDLDTEMLHYVTLLVIVKLKPLARIHTW